MTVAHWVRYVQTKANFNVSSGCTVITTCSPKHFELMRDRGADVVFDYVSTGHLYQLQANAKTDNCTAR
jgi:hypothetical protein